MKWIKKGLIFCPNRRNNWSQLYAMMPTPVRISKDIIRIFYGTTDVNRFGRPSYIDCSASNPSQILSINENFISDLGAVGTFDDSGVIPSSVVEVENKLYLYYVGFQRSYKVPYMLFSGLLIGDSDGSNFVRYSQAPIIDRTIDNFISNAAPCVLYDQEHKIFRMWFWVGKNWTSINGKAYIQAGISYTESHDGKTWNKPIISCLIPDESKSEFSLGRPWVRKVNKEFEMFYSIRYYEKLYRLGYAVSIDGINWIRRDDKMNLDVSETGWDSEMICYSSVVSVDNKDYLFYNGNNNGETGFGYAELDRA